jgi:hypothetical protein
MTPPDHFQQPMSPGYPTLGVWMQHIGKHIAWTEPDATVVAVGDDDADVYDRVRALGLRPDEVRVSYVWDPDVAWL